MNMGRQFNRRVVLGGWPVLVTFLLLLILVAGCRTAGDGAPPSTSVDGTGEISVSISPTLTDVVPPEPTWIPPGECSITLVQTDFWDGISGVAGEYPIWMTSSGTFTWSKLGPIVLPPALETMDLEEGRLTKIILFVDKSVEGDLHAQGRQLDGDHLVYFPTSEMTTRLSETTLQLNRIPPQVSLVEDAHISTNLPEPEGRSQLGWGALFPSPGCYQFTFEIEDHTVEVVVEITTDGP